MFLENKYSLLYFKIVNNRRASVPTGYCEKHHVIPKSLGGSDTPENLVALTAREHFICHRLLVKMTTGSNLRKMQYALHAVMHMRKDRSLVAVSSRQYEILKKQFSDMRKFPRSEETRKRMSLAKLGKKRGPRTEEERQKISAGSKGKIISDETKRKIGMANTGKRWSHTPEAIAKITAARRSRA
jgi:hypothetical protein